MLGRRLGVTKEIWHRIDDANSFLYENVSGDLTNDTDPSPNYFRLITLLVCYILILFILFVIIIPGVKCYCSIDVPRDRLTFPTTFQSPPPQLWSTNFVTTDDDWWRRRLDLDTYYTVQCTMNTTRAMHSMHTYTMFLLICILYA